MHLIRVILLCLFLTPSWSLSAPCKPIKSLADSRAIDVYLEQLADNLLFGTDTKKCFSEEELVSIFEDEAFLKEKWISPSFSSIAEIAYRANSVKLSLAFLDYYKKIYQSSANESLADGFAILFRERTAEVLEWLNQIPQSERSDLIKKSTLGFGNIHGTIPLRERTMRRIIGVNWEVANTKHKHYEILNEVSNAVRKEFGRSVKSRR